MILSNPTNRYKPFIKWVGGKRGLLEQIIPLLPKRFYSYHEPFLGGGALFFELYSLGELKNKKIYLSDINVELVNTYNTVKNSPDKLIRNLEKYKSNHSKEFYYHIRELDREDDYSSISNLDKATRFIYLNKTCFNGLYRVNKRGYFNTPMGSYKNPNIVDRDTILSASEALQNATIEVRTFDKITKYAKRDDFVYFDPPYYPLTKTANFTSYDSNIFLDDKQKELFDIFEELDKIGCQVAHSNSDTIFIKELYKDFNITLISANRFINSKKTGRGKINEVFITNYN